MKLEALRELRCQQGVNVANASRGAREKEMSLYRRLELLVRQREVDQETQSP